MLEVIKGLESYFVAAGCSPFVIDAQQREKKEEKKQTSEPSIGSLLSFADEKKFWSRGAMLLVG